MKRPDLPGCMLLVVALVLALWAGLHLASCSPTTSSAKPSCTDTQRAALLELYKVAVDKTISSGACDKYADDVAKCPAYRVIEEHFAVAETAMCTR